MNIIESQTGLDVVRLAKEAGFEDFAIGVRQEQLERFAALVRAETVRKCVEACDMQALKEKDYGFDPLQRQAYRQGLLNCGGALWEILK